MAEKIATREAYGKALAELGETYPNLVVLDADLSGSTNSARFAKVFPERFFNIGTQQFNDFLLANFIVIITSVGRDCETRRHGYADEIHLRQICSFTS